MEILMLIAAAGLVLFAVFGDVKDTEFPWLRPILDSPRGRA